MRGVSIALLTCALFSGTCGSVHRPAGAVEVEILPGGDGDVSNAEIARRLRQIVVNEAGAFERPATDSSPPVRLTEKELASKVARLQNYEHLIKLGAVGDLSVVRAALLAAGGNVPRAAIELRKASEMRLGGAPAILAQETTCMSHCPRPRKGDAWVHVQSRDCFLQCYTGATVPTAAGEADELEPDLEMDRELAGEILAAVGGEASASRSLKVTTTLAAQFDLERSCWFISACAALLLTIVWVTGAATREAKPHCVLVDLERLVALRASSALSDDEFAAAKRALLLRSGSTATKSMDNIAGVLTGRRHRFAGEQQPRLQKSKSWPLGAAEVARSSGLRVL